MKTLLRLLFVAFVPFVVSLTTRGATNDITLGQIGSDGKSRQLVIPGTTGTGAMARQTSPLFKTSLGIQNPLAFQLNTWKLEPDLTGGLALTCYDDEDSATGTAFTANGDGSLSGVTLASPTLTGTATLGTFTITTTNARYSSAGVSAGITPTTVYYSNATKYVGLTSSGLLITNSALTMATINSTTGAIYSSGGLTTSSSSITLGDTIVLTAGASGTIETTAGSQAKVDAVMADPTSSASLNLRKWTNGIKTKRELKLTKFKTQLAKVYAQRTLGQITDLQTASLIIYGDSTGQTYFPSAVKTALLKEYNFRGAWAGPASDFSVSGYGTLAPGAVDSGTIIHAHNGSGATAPNFDLSPIGAYFELQATGNLVSFFVSSPFVADTATVVYYKKSGGGTFKIQTLNLDSSSDIDGSGGWQDAATIDTSAASGSVATATVTFTRGPGTRVRCIWVSGSCDIAGTLLEDSTSSGLILTNLATGGLDGSQTNTMSVASMTTWLNLLHPDLITYQQKDASTYSGELAILEGFASLVKTAVPGTPILWIANYPDIGAPTESACAALNASSYTAASEYSEDEVWDPQVDVPDNAAMIARNWRRVLPGFSVTSITRSGSTATVTLGSAHGQSTGTGYYLEIAGADQSEYNVTFAPITAVPSGTQLSYTVSGTPATPATGSTLKAWLVDVTHVNALGQNELIRTFMEASGLLTHWSANATKPITTSSAAVDTLALNGYDQTTKNRELRNAYFGERGGISFTGSTSNYIFNNTPVATIGAGSFTVCGWFRVPTGPLTDGEIFGLRSSLSGSNQASSFSLGYSTGQAKLALSVRDSGNTTTTVFGSGTTTQAGTASYEWAQRVGSIVFVAVRRNASATGGEWPLTVWIGDTKYIATGGTYAIALNSDLSGSYLKLGAVSSSVASTGLECYGIRYFQSALTDAQIQKMARDGSAPTGATIDWAANELRGSVLHDRSGNGIDGIWVEAATGISWVWPQSDRPRVVTANSTQLVANEAVVTGSGNGNLNVLTLPASPKQGDWVAVSGYASGKWKVAQPAGAQIVTAAGGTVGTNATTAGTGGYIQAAQRYDAIKLRCVYSNTSTPSYIWVVDGAVPASLTWN
jgi:hypothetical protein